MWEAGDFPASREKIDAKTDATAAARPLEPRPGRSIMAIVNNDSTRTVQVRITGRVQGVWYRGWTEKTARALGLSGWVRNRRDGSVEAVFSGPPAAVDDMLARCADGPPSARVAGVEIVAENLPPVNGFETLPTA